MVDEARIQDTPAADGVLPRTARGRWFVVAVLLGALLARGVVIMATRDGYTPRTDALDYDLIATSLANGDGYGETHVPGLEGPTALRAPAYPASLAAVYFFAGDHAWTMGRLVNGLFGTVVVALTGLLAAMLFGRRVGAIALVLAAVHPTLILYTTGLQLEPLLVALQLGVLACVLEHRRAPRGMRWPLLAGVLLGLAMLTREVALFLVVPCVLLLLWPRRERSLAAVKPALAFLAVATVVVVPWTIRNYVQIDGFFPVTSGSGYALAGTYNETARNDPDYPAQWIGPQRDPTLREVGRNLEEPTEAAFDRAMRSAALDYIRDNPSYLAEVAFWNTVRLFDLQGPGYAVSISQFSPYPPKLVRISVFASYLVIALALASLAVPAVRRLPKPVWLLPVLACLGFVFISANFRYRASIEPFFVILAAVAVAHFALRDSELATAGQQIR